jgi:MFS family permease
MVLAAGVCSLILAGGIARFAYTPLLPMMQNQAGLGVAEGGWLAAINYIGYLSGAFAASRISDMVLKDRLYRIGMVVAVVSTLMMGLTTNIYIWAFSRLIAGMSTAAGMLLSAGLVLNWLMRHDFRSELGVHFAGIGLGMAGAAGAVELMNLFALDWSAQWLVFSGLALLLLYPSLAWLPPPDGAAVSRSGQALVDRPPSVLFMRVFMVFYFCAGFGYVVTATFVVAIVDHLPGLHGRGALVFLAAGLGGAPAAILWDQIARRTGQLLALALASFLQIGGIILPALDNSLTASLVGAVLFGATMVGIVSLALTMAGRFYPTTPAKMMGKMTLAYGVAQVIAPALVGQLARHFGGYMIGLSVAAALMTLGAALAVLLYFIESRETEARWRASVK